MLANSVGISLGVCVFAILFKLGDANFASATAAVLVTAMTIKSAEEYFG